MTKQFTPDEVRVAQEWLQVEADMSSDQDQRRGLIRVRKMVRIFADRLEAEEKAVPVYQHRSRGGPRLRWFDCTAETYELMERNEHDREHFDRRILYAHPASSDAERLVEALRAKVRQLRNMPKGEFQLAGSVFANDLEHIIADYYARSER